MWIQYGTNFIGHSTNWVRAMNTHYPVPEGIHRLIPEAKPWPVYQHTAPPPATGKKE